jgi:hypothetical protein
MLERRAAPLHLVFTDYEQIYARKRTRRQRIFDEMEIMGSRYSFQAQIKPATSSRPAKDAIRRLLWR